MTPLREVAGTFLKLGLTSFGGPVAHLAYLRDECVERRRWLEDAEYADLVALCQFLPGPSSSQVVFGLGLKRAGLPGALVASLLFLLPSAVLMIAFAYGLSGVGVAAGAPWLAGLKVAAVAVVAHAVWSMAKSLCPDWPRRTLALAAAAAAFFVPGAPMQLGLIVAGGAVGMLLTRRGGGAGGAAPSSAAGAAGPPGVSASAGAQSSPSAPVARAGPAGLSALVLFALLLVLPRMLALGTGSHAAAFFDAFYRPGALVFGGGHVVLPLLREALVPRGWLTDDAFLAGYGAAQAVPGPLFSLAGYLGTAIEGSWLGGVAALFAIFLPAWLLVGGALPFWTRLRAKAWMQAALKGTNAAVVGLLLAALVSPVGAEGLHGPAHVGLAVLGFAVLLSGRAPAWLVVVACAGVGQWLFATA